MSRVSRHQRTRSDLTKSGESESQPLWKRVNEKGKQQVSVDTETTSNKISIKQQIPTKQAINEFLRKVQKKISQSRISSQSQILEQIAIDWPEQLTAQSRITLLSRAISLNDTQSTAKQCNHCLNVKKIKQINNVDKLLLFLSELNPKIGKQLQAIIDQNKQMKQQAGKLKNQLSKCYGHVGVMSKHIAILEKRNQALLQDFQNIRKQVKIQIQIEEEKIRYTYQKMFQQMKENIQKKLQMSSSTKSSSSTKLTKLQKIDSFDFNTESNKKGVKERFEEQRQAIKSGNKSQNMKEKISREWIKTENNSQAGSDYDRIVQAIIKPNRKQIRSLKLPTRS